jgi:hypothetical protein
MGKSKKSSDKQFYIIIGAIIVVGVAFKYKDKFGSEAPVVARPAPKKSPNTQAPQVPSEAKSNLYEVALKCTLTEKKVLKTEEEYNADVEKMKRIGRSAESTEKFKYIKEDVCESAKYCDTGDPFHSFGFSKKEFTIKNDDKLTLSGTYQIDNKVIKITPLESPPAFLYILKWDKLFNITAIKYLDKTYETSACKSPEEEKEIRQKLAAAEQFKIQEAESKIANEAKRKEQEEEEEKERIEKQKKAVELAEQAKLEREQQEKARFQAQKLGSEEETEEQKIKKAKEKLAKEKAERDRLELESIKKAK